MAVERFAGAISCQPVTTTLKGLRLLTTVRVELHPSKVIAQDLGIRIIVTAPATRLAWPTIVPVLVLLVVRLVLALVEVLLNLLLDQVNPAVDFGLRLVESLTQILADHGKVVVDEAVLSVIFVKLIMALLLATRSLLTTVRGPPLVVPDVVEVLRELARVELVRLQL